jgi:hypothetical protein
VHLSAGALTFTTDDIQCALGNVSVYVHEWFVNVCPKVGDQDFTVFVEHVDELLQYLEMKRWCEDLAP